MRIECSLIEAKWQKVWQLIVTRMLARYALELECSVLPEKHRLQSCSRRFNMCDWTRRIGQGLAHPHQTGFFFMSNCSRVLFYKHYPVKSLSSMVKLDSMVRSAMFHKNRVGDVFLSKYRQKDSDFCIGIFSSTLKKNILFGKEHDPTLFRKVIHAAALEAVGSSPVTMPKSPFHLMSTRI